MPPPAITPDMTVLEVVATYRETEAVFRHYDSQAGECICCNALFDSLQEVAGKYGLGLEALLTDLRATVPTE